MRRRIGLALILFIPHFWTCHKPLSRPELLSKADTLRLPSVNLYFHAEKAEWKAILMSCFQPIPIPSNFKMGILELDMRQINGLINGPANLEISGEGNFFCYPFWLTNKGPIATHYRDFHSPKTVNPDSGLYMQVLNHENDLYGNLVNLDRKTILFSDRDIQNTPRAGTFRAIAEEPLTSYYVQPGSCISIPLQGHYLGETNRFEVMAGPLLDAFNNRVSDGTLVQFHYKEGLVTFCMETVSLAGMGKVFIPNNQGQGYAVWASVDKTISSLIPLKP